MRFHNNNITVVVVDNPRKNSAFAVRQSKDGKLVREVILGLSTQAATFDFGDGDLVIERRDSDATGFILNTGIRQVSLEYWLRKAGPGATLGSVETIVKPVGPSTDTIPMGTFREIGAGPGVEWHVTAFRGQEDQRHKNLRK